MDPLSIIASISGLIAFASKITIETRSFFGGWTDAPADVRLALNDADAMIDSLKDLKQLFQDAELENSPLAVAERAKFQPVIEDCQETFRQLRALMKDYRMVGSSSLQRTKWLAVGQKDYEKIARRMEALKTTLILKLALTRSAFEAIKQSMDTVEISVRQIQDMVANMQGFFHHMNSPSSAGLFGQRNMRIVDWLESAATYAASVADDTYTRSVLGSVYAETEVGERDTETEAAQKASPVPTITDLSDREPQSISSITEMAVDMTPTKPPMRQKTKYRAYEAEQRFVYFAKIKRIKKPSKELKEDMERLQKRMDLDDWYLEDLSPWQEKARETILRESESLKYFETFELAEDYPNGYSWKVAYIDFIPGRTGVRANMSYGSTRVVFYLKRSPRK